MSKREVIVVGKNGLVTLPYWAWTGLLKQSGSKAKSASGQRRAIKKAFIEALLKGIASKA